MNYNTSDIFGGSYNASAHYDAVKVQLASPETIRGWSHGEVTEITPARLSERVTERVQQLTSAIYDILNCRGIIRIDYIITEGDKINMLEINTTPGMTSTSFIPQQVRAAGLDIKEVMTDIIEDILQKKA